MGRLAASWPFVAGSVGSIRVLTLHPARPLPGTYAAPWCDIAIIWARDTESGAVNAFIVRCKSNPGYSCTKIENKIALRCVQVRCGHAWGLDALR